MKRVTMLAVLLLGAGVLACDDDEPTGPEEEVFQATLTGAAERPNPVTTSATGSATVRYNPTTGMFSYTLAANNITGVTNAHIHGPATTEQSAGVLVPLMAPVATATVNGTFTAANISVTTVSVDSLLKLMRGGLTYVNVHNSTNASGHIRGQLTRQ